MQVPWYPLSNQFLSQDPTVGHLMALCEESYVHLAKMAPEIKQLSGTHQSCLDGHIDLHLEILDQAPYTTLIHLTYFFDHHEGQHPDPDAVLCAYHDAKQVEVVDLKQKDLPLERLFHAPSLRNRWRLNLFACKWLAFCARQGHVFTQESSGEYATVGRSAAEKL